MFVQTEITPNPNSLKFIPGKVVSSAGSFEVSKNDNVNNELVRNILSVNGVEGIFLSKDFISVNKYDENSWDDIKHIVISHINEFYASGKEFVINKDLNEANFYNYTKKFMENGATILGGCCEIRPSHIKKISELKNYN